MFELAMSVRFGLYSDIRPNSTVTQKKDFYSDIRRVAGM